MITIFAIPSTACTTGGYAASEEEKNNALFRAAFWCEKAKVESLLKEGANLNAQCEDGKSLTSAVEAPMVLDDRLPKPPGKCTGVAKLLVAAKADVNVKTREEGLTPLMIAGQRLLRP